MSSVLPSTIEQLGEEVRALRASLDGDAVTPQDEDWDEARQAWSMAVEQRPAMVVLPESTDDIVEAVRFARRHGLRVAPQSTGHNAGPLALEQTILLKGSRMRGVEIDPVARIARVEPGALWLDVVGPAAELVTADGELRRVDADTDPYLFWAVRGGGGSFGAVTALEFRLFPITSVYAGMFAYPQERAAEVLHAWRELLPALPDEMTTVGRILDVPPLEEIPEFLRGRRLVVVEAIYLGDEAEGAELIAPLRELGPELDTFATIPPEALVHLHMDPPHPVPGKGDHLLLREDMPAEAIDAMLAVGMAPTPEIDMAVAVDLAKVKDALARYDAGREYLNFAEERTDASRLVDAGSYERLRRVKAQYDPADLFRSNHPIPPAR